MAKKKESAKADNPTAKTPEADTQGTITITPGDLQNLVAQQVQDALKGAVTQPVPSNTPEGTDLARALQAIASQLENQSVPMPKEGDLYPGMAVPPHWQPPRGWQKIPFQGGAFEAHRSVSKYFDPDMTAKLTKAVIQNYEMIKPKDLRAKPDKKIPVGHPDYRPPIVRMEINGRFRQIIKNQLMWDDYVPLMQVPDDHFQGDPKLPKFRFIVQKVQTQPEDQFVSSQEESIQAPEITPYHSPGTALEEQYQATKEVAVAPSPRYGNPMMGVGGESG